MPSYIQLFRWTDQGSQNVKASPDRVAAAVQSAASMGVQLKDVYLTMGQYDLIAVIEAPDDEALARFTLMLGSAGNVHTETLRAFTQDEFRQIVGGLP